MSSLHRSLVPVLLLMVACTAPAAPPAPAAQEAVTAVAPAKILDGVEKSLVVVGYSTSYVWPRLLQGMLDEHAGGEGTYHVLSAVIGGSPVGRWISEPGSEDYEATFGLMLRDFFGPEARLRGAAPEPTVAIVQQSLQRTPTPATRLGPVTAANDAEGIRTGADALEQLATQLHDSGIEHVVMAMHIYKEGYEPEVGNERFALEALLRRGVSFVSPGPDVWSLTIREHPAAFTEDRLHPNERGARIMAEAWYRALAGEDADPNLIESMQSREIDQDGWMHEYLDWRRSVSN